MNILVVDDHKDFRDEMLAMLTRNGHQADGAVNADSAIPLAESGKYQFVLVDYNMPVHDGIWFMENVKLPRGTKALLITAHVYKEMIKRMFRLGVAGYIIKPFEEAVLMQQLNFHSQLAGAGGPPVSGGVPASKESRGEQASTQGDKPSPEGAQPPSATSLSQPLVRAAPI